MKTNFKKLFVSSSFKAARLVPRSDDNSTTKKEPASLARVSTAVSISPAPRPKRLLSNHKLETKANPPTNNNSKCGREFEGELQAYLSQLISQLQQDPTQDLGVKILVRIKDLLRDIGEEQLVNEWRNSADCCKKLVVFLVSEQMKERAAATKQQRSKSSNKTKHDDPDRRSETSPKMSVAKRLALTKKTQERICLFEADKPQLTPDEIQLNKELSKIKKEKARLEELLKEEGSFNEDEVKWNKESEKSFRTGKKTTLSLNKGGGKLRDATLFRNCSPNAFWRRAVISPNKAAGTCITFANVCHYLEEREEAMQDGGWLRNSLTAGLENVYAEVLKLIVSDKVVSEFEGNIATVRQQRMDYCVKTANKNQLRTEKMCELRRKKEELKKKNEEFTKLSKRIGSIMRGYNNNQVTTPISTRLYSRVSPGKAGEAVVVKPVILTDKLNQDNELAPNAVTTSGNLNRSGYTFNSLISKGEIRRRNASGPDEVRPKPTMDSVVRSVAIIKRCFRRFKLRNALKKRMEERQKRFGWQVSTKGVTTRKSEMALRFSGSGFLRSRTQRNLLKTCDAGDKGSGRMLLTESRDRPSFGSPATAWTSRSRSGTASLAAGVLDAARKNSLGYIRKKQQKLSPEAVNVRDTKGNTPLYYLCAKGNFEAAKILLLSGADVNAQNEHGDTALHAAFRLDHKELVGMLLDKGADAQICNDFGQTPLYFAKPVTSKKFGLHELPVRYGDVLEKKD